MKKIILFILLVSVVSFSLFSGVSSFDTYLGEQMRKQDIPALSILVFKNSDILYQKYLGKADVEKNIALSEEHVFLIASVSKVITATALMQLYDKGLFGLDDSINEYLDFKVENPDYKGSITFKMLLTHTSSIADGPAMDDQYYYGKDSPVDLGYFMKNYFSRGGKYYNRYENFCDFKPGSEFEYSNIGSALIAVLVEEISGQDFNTYCKNNIFKPLKMTNSYWKLSETNIKKVVRPYDEFLRPLEHYTFTDYPNGGLRTNVRDLFNLLSAFANGGIYNGYKLLAKKTVDMMLTPQIKQIDSTAGLHFFKMNEKYNLWGHDGGEEGVSTIMAFNRGTGIGVIILTNQGEADLDNILIKAYEMGVGLASK